MALIRKKSLFGLGLLGLLFINNIADAEDQQRLYRSAYFLGRGDTGIAIADDEDAIFYNPAGLALGKGIYKKTVLVSPLIEVSEDTRSLAKQMLAQDGTSISTLREHVGKPQHAGLYNFTGIVLRRAALGAFASATTDLLISKDPESGGLEKLSANLVNNAGLTFSLADTIFSENLMVGVTGKYLYRGVADIDVSVIDAKEFQSKKSSELLGYGTGAGADLGLMYLVPGRTPRSFGISVLNVGHMPIIKTNEDSADLDKLKQTVNVGLALEPGTQFSKFRLLVDVWDVTNSISKNALKKIHVGGELTVRDFIGFTVGINQGAPSAGFYVDMYLARLDIGMYTEETDDRVGTRPDRRLYLRLKMGF